MLLRRVGFRSAGGFFTTAASASSAIGGTAAPTVAGTSVAAAVASAACAFPTATASNLLSSSTSLSLATAYRYQANNAGGAVDDAALNHLLEEVMMLTSTPIPIGTLFKSLSQESRQTLLKQRMPLETFLLRHKDTFSVYKNGERGQIMACRVTDVPISAMKGVEATADQMFSGKSSENNLHAVYTVLKYIPNEWSPFVSLGIPEEIRVKFMNKKPKAFFEAHPKYFEVKAQALRSHTFEVRRSLALQQATAAQQPPQ